MANRRMFSLDVVDTDKFLDMPATSQNLYFHLGMRADDDGFVSSPKKITKLVNCSPDDLNVLVSRGFVIAMGEGIVVIRHWRQNNYIQADRYKGTIYQKHLASLNVIDGAYEMDTECIQAVSIMEAQDRSGENKLVKGKEGENTGLKREKQKEVTVYFPDDQELEEAFQGYIAMRRRIQKPMTERAIKLAIAKLKDMATLPFSEEFNHELVVEILNQSVMNSWQGLFPIKDTDRLIRKEEKNDGKENAETFEGDSVRLW